MKAVQFTIDEELLRRIDRDPEVKRVGRSAFLRQAVREYLSRRRDREIRAAYRRGYGQKPVGSNEFGPLMEGQAWPED
jgi:metal-responsive CopG/Arc/MetJ family transcriptional regulator